MMRGFVRRWVTRRGTFLVSFGAVYIILGYSILTLSNSPTTNAAAHKALRFALEIAPLSVYGWLWIASGAVAIAAGVLSRYEVIGFGIAAFMPTLWALVYFTAWDTLPRAWLSAAVYLLLATSVLIVAGMPDPAELEELRRAINLRSSTLK